MISWRKKLAQYGAKPVTIRYRRKIGDFRLFKIKKE
jgi:hypothetical protein